MEHTKADWEKTIRKSIRDYDNIVRFSERLATVKDFTEMTLRAAKKADDMVELIHELLSKAREEERNRVVDECLELVGEYSGFTFEETREKIRGLKSFRRTLPD